ncbi:CopG family transcriptional regulator [Oligoflexus tunisiensis]|uniref:ribbon-helix-helix domain-containing protein n=1 Tax=Oligoflexus tunisiensis TaxID=708132 RepID=UPI000A57E790|nr:CopG family transcriptional regulator [Oligoflexus tunisiensis]
MPNSGVSRKPSTLTVQLDDTLLAQLERQAAQSLVSVDELVRRAIRESLSAGTPKASKKTRPSATRHDEAPLDAFLPEGVDPFTPADVVTGLATNFEEVQARMRFAGTPALLRDLG